jgi:hypothetical protein
MTIQEVAEREGISQRQAQRYCREGFKGHVLPSVKLGKAWSIDPKDYAAWRVACGFEQAQPEAPPQVAVTASPGDALPASDSPGEAHPSPASPGDAPPAYPPYPMPADPHGVLTNAPHPHSCNHPHPLACEDYMKQEAAKLIEKYRGDPPDEN